MLQISTTSDMWGVGGADSHRMAEGGCREGAIEECGAGGGVDSSGGGVRQTALFAHPCMDEVPSMVMMTALQDEGVDNGAAASRCTTLPDNAVCCSTPQRPISEKQDTEEDQQEEEKEQEGADSGDSGGTVGVAVSEILRCEIDHVSDSEDGCQFGAAVGGGVEMVREDHMALDGEGDASCNTLRHTATDSTTVQHINGQDHAALDREDNAQCKALQHTATNCTTLRNIDRESDAALDVQDDQLSLPLVEHLCTTRSSMSVFSQTNTRTSSETTHLCTPSPAPASVEESITHTCTSFHPRDRAEKEKEKEQEKEKVMPEELDDDNDDDDVIVALKRLGDPAKVVDGDRICFKWNPGEWYMGTMTVPKTKTGKKGAKKRLSALFSTVVWDDGTHNLLNLHLADAACWFIVEGRADEGLLKGLLRSLLPACLTMRGRGRSAHGVRHGGRGGRFSAVAATHKTHGSPTQRDEQHHDALGEHKTAHADTLHPMILALECAQSDVDHQNAPHNAAHDALGVRKAAHADSHHTMILALDASICNTLQHTVGFGVQSDFDHHNAPHNTDHMGADDDTGSVLAVVAKQHLLFPAEKTTPNVQRCQSDMSVTVGEANNCIEAHLCLDSVLQCVAVNAEACDGEDFDMLQADSPQYTACSSPLKSHTSTSHVIDTQHSLHAVLTHAPQPTCASSLEHLHTPVLQHTDTTVLQHTDIGASQHIDTAAVQHADTTALHHTGTAEPQRTGTPALPHTPLGGSREGRAGRGEVFGTSSQCEVALGPRVIGITEKGDPRQSDPEGYGIVARRRLDK